MLYILASLILGVAIGVFSARHNKFFIGFLITSLPIVFLISRPVALVGASASATMGSKNPFHVYIVGFNQLPESLQAAILLFPFFVIGARGAVAVHRYFFAVEPMPETEDERRTRIMAEHEKKLKAHTDKAMRFK